MLNAIQWVKVPFGASGSSTTKASDFVFGGRFETVNGAAVPVPSQVTSVAKPPSLNGDPSSIVSGTFGGSTFAPPPQPATNAARSAAPASITFAPRAIDAHTKGPVKLLSVPITAAALLLAAAPALGRVAVVTTGGSQAAIVDLTAKQVSSRLETGLPTRGAAISASGQTGFVVSSNGTESRLTVIDLGSKQ